MLKGTPALVDEGKLLTTKLVAWFVVAEGVSTKAWIWPLIVPEPTIWPPSLMLDATVSTQPEPAGSSVLRSVIPPLFCQTKACVAVLPVRYALPTTWAELLMP